MKKMLLLCTGLLLAAGIASAQVTSENIVGYQQFSGSSSGRYTMLAPPFISVTNLVREIKLKSITGDFEFFNSVQFFDSNANVSLEAFWLPDWFDPPYGPGWYDGDDWGVYLGNTTIPLGEACFVVTDGGVNGFVAGQVDTNNICLKINSIYACIGNATHTPKLLKEFEIEDIDFFNSIQIFDGDANISLEAFWLPDWFSPLYGPGWYDGEDWEVYLGNTSIAPAEGFFLVTDGQPVTVTIPGL